MFWNHVEQLVMYQSMPVLIYSCPLNTAMIMMEDSNSRSTAAEEPLQLLQSEVTWLRVPIFNAVFVIFSSSI